LTTPEQTFDDVVVFRGRHDIIGDLFRRRQDLAGNFSDAGLDELEILAAVAVSHGMSTSIVARASGVPAERVNAVLDTSPALVRRQMAAYRREPSGIVIRTTVRLD
jgi:hypothetical protein